MSTIGLERRSGFVANFVIRQPLGTLGLVVILLMAFAAIFAKWVAPFDPIAVDYGAMLARPGPHHWLGTDAFGRDVFSRIIYGARTALSVGFIASFTSATLGTIIGVSSAYFSGKMDMLVQRVMDVMQAIPVIVLALVIVAILGRHVVGGLDINLVIAIALPMVPSIQRVVRSAALLIRELPYVEAAQATGCSHARIIFRHMIPNVAAPYLIMLTTFMAQAIIAEASLSFLGLGVAEPTPSWGLMLSGSAADFYAQAPWMIVFPGLAISIAVLAFNVLGDALRDYLDPR
ncbi:MAG TPA: ABC transporter permease [Candidatus Baltobacteraceae bacterium]|jgi:peptide/nickel transport system permease protein